MLKFSRSNLLLLKQMLEIITTHSLGSANYEGANLKTGDAKCT